MASRKENLKALFTNTRTRVIILFTIILLFVAIIIGVIKLGSSTRMSTDLSTNVGGAPVGIQSIPGAQNPTAQYASLVEAKNVDQATTAHKTGGSAIPTIIRTQAFGEGVEPIGPPPGAGGLGFVGLTEEEGGGVQRGLWLQNLKNANCSKASMQQVISQGGMLADLKGACSCIQLKDNGYKLGDLVSVCSCPDLKAAGFNSRQFKEAAFSAGRLRLCGFDACGLRNAGYNASEMKDGGFTDGELKGAGFSAQDIARAGGLPDGITADDVRKAGCGVDALAKLRAARVSASAIRRISGCSAAQLKAAGYSAKDLLDAGFTPAQLAAAGFTPTEITAAGGVLPAGKTGDCSVASLKAARASGVTAKTIRETLGCSAKDMKDAGYTAAELRDAGFTAAELKNAGFTAAELKAAGFSAKDLKDAGFTAAELKAAGFSAKDLKDAGFTAAELKAAGFSAKDLKDAGFTAAELKAAGFSAKDLKDAGFSAAELKAAGFSAKDLKDAGFTAAELKAAGFSAKDLKDAGFTAADLKAAGFSAKDLKDAGFTAADLKAAGFTAKDLKDAGYSAANLRAAGYSPAELQDAGFSPEEMAIPGLSDQTTIMPPPSTLTTIPSVVSIPGGPAPTNQANAQQLQDILKRQQSQMAVQRHQQAIQQQTSQMLSVANQFLQEWKIVPTQVFIAGTALEKGGKEGAVALGITPTSPSVATTFGSNPTATKALIKTGDVLFAVLDTSINSDEPGPILATVVSGRYKGAKLIGSFNLPSNADKMIISFNTMSVPGASKTTSINAYAIDPNTARTALSSSTDHHYLSRYGSLFAATFLEGFGNAFQSANTTITIGGTGGVAQNTTIQSGIGRSLLENAVIGLATLGKNWGQVAQQQFSRPTTVEVCSGTGLGILFTQDLTSL